MTGPRIGDEVRYTQSGILYYGRVVAIEPGDPSTGSRYTIQAAGYDHPHHVWARQIIQTTGIMARPDAWQNRARQTAPAGSGQDHTDLIAVIQRRGYLEALRLIAEGFVSAAFDGEDWTAWRWHTSQGMTIFYRAGGAPDEPWVICVNAPESERATWERTIRDRWPADVTPTPSVVLMTPL